MTERKIPQPEEIVVLEEKARNSMRKFLDCGSLAIAALRSYAQCIDSGFVLDEDSRKGLRTFVDSESNGILTSGRYSGLHCRLCIVGEDGGDVFVELSHEPGESFSVLSPKEFALNSVRGFYFPVKIDGLKFDVVVLDGGKSRVFFDQKKEGDKRKFLEGFGKKIRKTIISESFPNPLTVAFAAFLTDHGDGYTIDKLVAYPDSDCPDETD